MSTRVPYVFKIVVCFDAIRTAVGKRSRSAIVECLWNFYFFFPEFDSCIGNVALVESLDKKKMYTNKNNKIRKKKKIRNELLRGGRGGNRSF